MGDEDQTRAAPTRATFVIDTIQRLMRNLEAELSRTPRDPEQICELSRGLGDEADHAFSHPEIWGDESRYETALDLLERATKATVGTEYEESCAPRKEEFVRRVEEAREARRAMEPFTKIR